MKKPVKYALSSESQKAEMKAISECWDILQRLDLNGRHRAIRWLGSWASSESESDDFNFMDF